MQEHVELSHCPKNSVIMLKTLTELTSVVRTPANEIHQIKADSIIINNDMMSAIKGDIIEDNNDNVNGKFGIVEERVDHLFQRLGRMEKTDQTNQ